MWKNRPFQKGLGTGLIIGALLLQLMLSVSRAELPASPVPEPTVGSNQQPSPSASLTAEMIREKADGLGLQVFDKGIKLYQQKELDEAVAAGAATAKEEARAELEARTKTSAPAGDSNKSVTVFIGSGMSASNVAEYLSKSGVVEDRALFEQTMRDKQLNASIRTGLYTFHIGHDIQEIIAQITTPPKFSEQQ